MGVSEKSKFPGSDERSDSPRFRSAEEGSFGKAFFESFYMYFQNIVCLHESKDDPTSNLLFGSLKIRIQPNKMVYLSDTVVNLPASFTNLTKRCHL